MRSIPPGAEVDTAAGLYTLRSGRSTDREPIVLIHGGGYDSAACSWHRAMEPLGVDREVWAFDLPGFGGSIDRPPVGGPDRMAEAVLSAMSTVGLQRAVVIGVSMGGDVAMNVALTAPERVAGLVLVGAGGLVPLFRDRRTHRWARRAATLPDVVLRPLTRIANRFVRGAVASMVVDAERLPAAALAQFVADARHPLAGLGYARYNQACLGRDRMLNDLSQKVSAIEVPTCLFHGADDPLVDPAGSVRAAARMPAADILLVTDCGHWAQLEAHDRFIDAARTLLGRVDAAA